MTPEMPPFVPTVQPSIVPVAPIPPLAPVAPGIKSDAFSLEHGDLVVRWPARISQADFDGVDQWLTILRSKMKRCVVKSDAKEAGK